MTDAHDRPTLNCKALLALTIWVRNQNERHTSERFPGMEMPSFRPPITADLCTGEDSFKSSQAISNQEGKD